MNHRTWVEISTGAIVRNIKNYEKLLPTDTMLMAVVKADAYGHGIDIVSKSALSAGVDYLAVFDFTDAMVLRKNHLESPILVLSQIDIDNLDQAVKHTIDITVSSMDVLKKVLAYKKRNKLLINLKIDTGLSRQGFTLGELPKVLKLLESTRDVQIVSIYSHFIGAENKKFDNYTKKQTAELINWQTSLNEIGFYPLVHISATSGFLMKENTSFDMVRMGIGMYGLWPDKEVKDTAIKKLSLTPALSWKTRISEVKTITKGTTVAYDATFTATKDTRIAILPVGYYDGLPRSLSNSGYMLCGGVKCKILGRVMMNMCVIDVSSIKSPKHGDEVVIIGKQKSNSISAEDLALWAGTINYEIVTRINETIPRIAIK